MATPIPSWQEALDPQLVRYLLRPIEQPGLISRTLGRSLIERIYTFAPATLGDELLQRWGNLLGEHGASAPIVHATPVPDDGLNYPTWAPPPRGEQSPASLYNPTTPLAPPPLTPQSGTAPASSPPPTPQSGTASPSLPHAPLAALSSPAAPVPTDSPGSLETHPPAPAGTPAPAPPRPVVLDVIQRKEMPSGAAEAASPATLPLAPLPAEPMGGEGMSEPASAPSPAPPPVRPVVQGVSAPPPPPALVTLTFPALPVVRATPRRASRPTSPTPARPATGTPPLPPLPTRAELGTPSTAPTEPRTPPLLRPQPGTLPLSRPELGAPPTLRLQPDAPRPADSEMGQAALPQAMNQPTAQAPAPERPQPTATPPLRVVRETRREGIAPESLERLVVLAVLPGGSPLPPATSPRWVVRERPAQPPAALPPLSAGSPLPLGLPPTVQTAWGAGSVPDTPRPPGLGTLPSVLGAPPVVTGRAIPPSSPSASAPMPQQGGSETGTTAPPTPPPASEPDMEQLAERVQRRLLQALAVERERRGEGRW